MSQGLNLSFDDDFAKHYQAGARLLPSEINVVLNFFQKRIVDRTPAAYLTKCTYLNGYEFYVDERVLVPRSYLAELFASPKTAAGEDGDEELMSSIARFIDVDNVSSVMDLCTGSACLGIIMALNLPSAHVVAVDKSGDALQVARRNVESYRLQKQVTLVESDLFLNLDPSSKFDLILANPPYLTALNMQTLLPEFRHEPAMALDGQSCNGLQVVARILQQAGAWLKHDDSCLIVEVGNEENAAELEKCHPSMPFFWLDTSANPDRVAFLLRKSDLR